MTIQRNIPIPPAHKYPFRFLRPGDSVLHPCTTSAERARARKAAYRLAEHHQWSIVVRSQPDGVRVWRRA